VDEPTLQNFAPSRLRMAILAGAAAWAVPGLGHLLLRRWIRAGVYFCAVALMALTGYWLRGEVFTRHPVDGFSFLSFLAESGSGVFYFLAHRLESSGADLSRVTGDWGTRFLATAGVLNFLCVLEAVEIAMNRSARRP
jgi:hypothetical protein